MPRAGRGLASKTGLARFESWAVRVYGHQVKWVRCPGCGDRFPVDGDPVEGFEYDRVGGYCTGHWWNNVPLD